MILRSCNIGQALRARQRGFLLNPFRFGSTPATDPYWANVKFLLQPSGADASTSFADLSGDARTVTANGGAQVDTGRTFSGAPTLLCDGNGDYLGVSTTGLDPGTGDFCVETVFWLAAASANYRYLMRWAYAGGKVLSMRFGDAGYGARLQFSVDDAVLTSVYSASPTQTSLAAGWHHAAMSRIGGTVRAFLDQSLLTVRNNNFAGPAVTSWADSTNINTISAAEVSTAGTSAFDGSTYTARWTVGAGRYSAGGFPLDYPFPTS